MKKQLELFPELDLSSKEPIIYDGASGQLINKFKEKEVGPFETALNNVQNKGKRVPVRKPNAVPPKTKNTFLLKSFIIECRTIPCFSTN